MHTTQGEWKFVPHPDLQGNVIALRSGDADVLTISSAEISGVETVFATITRADARLIESAPKLLACLKRQADMLDKESVELIRTLEAA